MSEAKTKATFVTFYSFKGGVGRSMALINTAGILAGQRGFRVLVIDIDLEAPGLSYLDPTAPDESPAQAQRQLQFESGFVDLLADAKERGEAADLFTLAPETLVEKYTKAIDIPTASREFTDGYLRVMPAGKFDGAYAARLNALNIGQLYRDGLGEPLIRTFKKKFSESGLYDYVLIDSRTGLSDEAGMCTRDLADHLMILSGLNRQNVEGTSEFLKAFRSTAEKKTLQIILSPVPNGEDRLLDERENVAKLAFAAAWRAEIDVTLQIPYHPQLALTEEPHIFRRRKGYLFESYRSIERSMLRKLGHTAPQFQRRVRTAIQRRDYTNALQILRHMVRLENGKDSSSNLVQALLFSEQQRSSQSDVNSSRDEISLETLGKDEDGRAVLDFLIQWIPVGERYSLGEQLVSRLQNVSLDLTNKLFQRMTDAAPTESRLLISYAHFLTEKRGDPEAGETYYQRAVEVDSKDLSALITYAEFLVNKRNKIDMAEIYFQRAIEAEPKSSYALCRYARFLEEKSGTPDIAETYFRRAIEANPEDSYALRLYADFLIERRGDLDAAETYFQRAIEANPEDRYALRFYANFLIEKRGNSDAADIYFQRAIEAGPEDTWTLVRYAFFLSEIRGNLDLAENYFQRAIEADSKDSHALSRYASFLGEKRGNSDAAETYFQRAIEVAPKDIYSVFRYASFLSDIRVNLDAAEVYLRRAIEIEPENSFTLISYGDFLENKRRDLTLAETYFKRAVEAEPKKGSPLSSYADFLHQKRGDFDTADIYFRRAIDAAPYNSNYLSNYGQFLCAQGCFEEAQARLFLAFELQNYSEKGNLAEICFSLWLINRIKKRNGGHWERYFKFLIQNGFKRHPWSFDRMLLKAKGHLAKEEFKYAQALAAAFLDAGKVTALGKFPRWQTLKAIAPVKLKKKKSKK